MFWKIVSFEEIQIRSSNLFSMKMTFLQNYQLDWLDQNLCQQAATCKTPS